MREPVHVYELLFCFGVGLAQSLQPQHVLLCGDTRFLLFPFFPRMLAVVPQLLLGVNSRINVFNCLSGYLGCCILSIL